MLQRKIIFLTSVLPIITGILSTTIFFAQEKFRTAIISVYVLITILLIYTLSTFIKGHANWKHYLFLIILLLSCIWALFFNWGITDGCSFGICI